MVSGFLLHFSLCALLSIASVLRGMEGSSTGAISSGDNLTLGTLIQTHLENTVPSDSLPANIESSLSLEDLNEANAPKYLSAIQDAINPIADDKWEAYKNSVLSQELSNSSTSDSSYFKNFKSPLVANALLKHMNNPANDINTAWRTAIADKKKGEKTLRKKKNNTTALVVESGFSFLQD